MKTRTYEELSSLESYEDRYKYLQLQGTVAQETFGFDRYLNQVLYKDSEWRRTRDQVIIRDDGCDLGHKDHPIAGKIIVHHMNPINIEEVLNRDPIVFDPNYLICVSHQTHQAIHYGNEDMIPKDPISRQPNDTCPWKQ